MRARRKVVVEDGGFGICELKECRASGAERANVHNMCSGKSVSCLHELLHVTLSGFATRHRFFPLYFGVAATHLLFLFLWDRFE